MCIRGSRYSNSDYVDRGLLGLQLPNYRITSLVPGRWERQRRLGTSKFAPFRHVIAGLGSFEVHLKSVEFHI